MDIFAASHGVERKRKAGEIFQEVEVAAVAPESVGQVASVVLVAAQSEIIIKADIGGGGQEKKARFRRVTFSISAPADVVFGDGKHTTDPVSGEHHQVPARISNDDDSRLPSISTPADVVFGDGDQTNLAVGEHHQGLASGSGDQEAGTSSSSESSADLTTSPRIKEAEALEQSPVAADDTRTQGNQHSPLEACLHVSIPASVDVAEARDQDSCPSSPNPSDDDDVSEDDTGGGGIVPYRLRQRIAMEMDEDAIRLEVARQFGVDRQRRAARRRRRRRPCASHSGCLRRR
ncbi:hypothetical protein ACQ4PT_017926 [Festuca glaucescens]